MRSVPLTTARRSSTEGEVFLGWRFLQLRMTFGTPCRKYRGQPAGIPCGCCVDQACRVVGASVGVWRVACRGVSVGDSACAGGVLAERGVRRTPRPPCPPRRRESRRRRRRDADDPGVGAIASAAPPRPGSDAHSACRRSCGTLGTPGLDQLCLSLRGGRWGKS